MNKRLVWFTELFIWLVLIISIVLCCTYYFATEKMKNHSYFMFFEDVDGLTKGSPVRLMGLSIGHVQEVKVYKENIFVSFIVTEKNVYIPYGSFARVEFYGLGGSKSLEIYPASEKKDSEKDVIIAQNPYRIADYYKWGEQINTLLEAMSNNAAMIIDSFMQSGISISDINKTSLYVNDFMESIISGEKGFLNKLNSFSKKNDSHDLNVDKGEDYEY